VSHSHKLHTQKNKPLTIVSEIEVYEVENDVHELFDTYRPDAVYVAGVRSWECRCCDFTPGTGWELVTAHVGRRVSK